jgi:hypothetical protein
MSGRFNPIIGEEHASRVVLPWGRPATKPGEALVIFRPGQPLVTIWPNRLPDTRVVYSNAVIYRVDIADHLLTFRYPVPSRGDGFDFTVEVSMVCTVADPAVIVDRKGTKPYDTVERLLEGTMRLVTRRYQNDEGAEVEQAIKIAIANAISNSEYGPGLAFSSVAVKATPHEDTRKFAGNVIRAEHDSTLEEMRDTAKHSRLRKNLDVYGPMVRGGQWDVLALRLASNPDDIDGVLDRLASADAREQQQNWEAIKYFLDRDEMEGFHLDAPVRALLERFVERLQPDRSRAALPAPENPPGGAGRLRGTLSRPPTS